MNDFAQGIGSSFQTAASSGPLLLAVAACVLAGLVSFASPCVVPLVPGYLSYLAGISGADSPAVTPEDATTRPAAGRWRVTGAATMFVAGFTVVFVFATASVFGVISTLRINEALLQRVGGVITIVMGLTFIGLIPALQKDARFAPRRISSLPAHLCWGRVRVGLDTMSRPHSRRGSFGGGRNSRHDGSARVLLIVAYCLGLGLPFIVLAFGSVKALRGVGWLKRHSRTIQIVGGIMLVAVGLALVTGVWGVFIGWLRNEFVSSVVLPI
ncbi:cytochrome c biogenesis CcdA family protein [Rhodococcus baikonurensis]